MSQKTKSKKRIVAAIAVFVLAVAFVAPTSAAGFKRGIVISVDGVDYYFAGAPDGPNGEFDIPGHTWVQAGPNKLVGKHYNTGPFGAPSWWSSDAEDGAFLFKVDAIIDTWSEAKAARYADKGYVHYHELIRVSDQEPHPTKVAWLKHTARATFTFDGGPRPDLAHQVTPGPDFEFIPTWFDPYIP